MNNAKIYESVQAHYHNKAVNAAACCSPADSCCEPSTLDLGYQADQLATLPDEITEMSLGCGDPVTIASLKAGEVVVDLGSGAGMDSFFAVQQVGESGFVYGIDMTPAMLEKARQNAARLGVKNVEFREGMIEAIPLPDATADVILSNCVINLSPDKAAVFSEAFRILKPGGRFAVSDMVTQGASLPMDAVDVETWSACISGAIEVTQYEALLQAAGFTDIQVVDKRTAEEVNVLRANDSPDQPRLLSARITATKPAS